MVEIVYGVFWLFSVITMSSSLDNIAIMLIFACDRKFKKFFDIDSGIGFLIWLESGPLFHEKSKGLLLVQDTQKIIGLLLFSVNKTQALAKV